jgi:hypothetical protein
MGANRCGPGSGDFSHDSVISRASAHSPLWPWRTGHQEAAIRGRGLDLTQFPDAADGRKRTSRGRTVDIANRCVLLGFNESTQHRALQLMLVAPKLADSTPSTLRSHEPHALTTRRSRFTAKSLKRAAGRP